jgi:hypothetical protein
MTFSIRGRTLASFTVASLLVGVLVACSSSSSPGGSS